MYEVTFTHDYHGEITLAGHTASEILRQAMTYDHDCSDTVGCDVAHMTRGGYLLIATSRMFGATECPTLSAVVAELPAGEFTREAIDAEENEWWQEASRYALHCPECNSVMIGDDEYPEHCTNCAHDIDVESAEKITPRVIIPGEVITDPAELSR
jgi:hypothetical protein